MKKIIILILLFTITFFSCLPIMKEKELKEKYIFDANKYYYEDAKIINDSKLYKKENSEFKEVGDISKDTLISLEKPSKKDKYFKIKNTEYYISYRDITMGDKKNIDSKYKRWIPFNENVEGTNLTLYQNDKKIYTFYERTSLPIYRKVDDKYYVSYQDELYYTLKNEVEVVPKENSNSEKATEVSVLNYHFFYDPSKDDVVCDQIICHTKDQFVSQLEYLKNNSYTTLTAEELKFFLKNEINIPKKSLVITIDDGWLANLGVDLLIEYKMYGTLFLATASYVPDQYNKSEYVKFESHSHDMHNVGVCPGGQGGAIKCWPDEKILEDLKKSQEILGGSTVFCYPFYEYTYHSIELLKSAGFEMAFKGGNKKATPGIDLFQIPRYVIGSDTTLNDFIRKL